MDYQRRFVILRGDLRKRIRLVAIFIVLLRDLPDTGEAAFDLGSPSFR